MKNIFIKMLDMVLPIVLPLIISNAKVMKTIAERNDYRVVFNGSKTYMVIDSANQCLFASSSKIKAINKMNKQAEAAGQ